VARGSATAQNSCRLEENLQIFEQRVSRYALPLLRIITLYYRLLRRVTANYGRLRLLRSFLSDLWILLLTHMADKWDFKIFI